MAAPAAATADGTVVPVPAAPGRSGGFGRAVSAIARWQQRRRGVAVGAEGTAAAVQSLARELAHDAVRLVPALALCGIGIALTYGVCVPVEGAPERLYWRRQIAFLFLGLMAYAVIAKGYAGFLSRRVVLWAVYLVFCIGLPALVLFAGQKTGNGLRWLPLGLGFSVQPAEFAKVALVWVVAELVNPGPGAGRVARVRGHLAAAAAVVAPAVLVYLERSMGNTALLCAAVGTVLALRWVPTPVLALCGSAAVLGLVPLALEVAAIRHPTPRVNLARYEAREGRRPESLPIGLTPREVGSAIAPAGAAGLLSHCPDRFACYLSYGGGWNARQALRCVRVGAMEGTGYRAGNITTLGFLPRTVQHTDFIYCVLSESFGFRGAMVVLGLIAWLIMVILWQGARSASPAGWSFSAGFATLLFLQTFIHVGMALRLVPIIGIPLPFVSYGGTFLLTSFAALGLVARYDSPLAVPLPAPAGEVPSRQGMPEAYTQPALSL